MRIQAAKVLSFSLLCFGVVASAQQATDPAQAHHGLQIPDKFKNLQVLPKNISKEQLVGTMRLITRSLGVRCDFCHEISEAGQNFASDKKDEKSAARNMMKMVHEINTHYMPKLEPLPGEEPKQTGVNCWTCHRGHKEPEQGPPPEEHREGPPPPGMGPNMGQQPTPPS